MKKSEIKKMVYLTIDNTQMYCGLKKYCKKNNLNSKINDNYKPLNM